MKKTVVMMLSILLGFGILRSQVGINNDSPHPSSSLDLGSNTRKGFIITKVSLTGTDDVTTIINPELGMIVYNTSDANTGLDNEVKANDFYVYTTNGWSNKIDGDDLTGYLNDLEMPKLAGYYFTTYATASGNSYSTGGTSTFAFESRGSDIMKSDTSTDLIKKINRNEFEVVQDGTYEIYGFFSMLIRLNGSNIRRTTDVYVKRVGSSYTAESRDVCHILTNYNSLTAPCYYKTILTLNKGDRFKINISYLSGNTPQYVRVAANSSLGVPFSSGLVVKYYN